MYYILYKRTPRAMSLLSQKNNITFYIIIFNRSKRVNEIQCQRFLLERLFPVLVPFVIYVVFNTDRVFACKEITKLNLNLLWLRGIAELTTFKSYVT